MDSPPETLPESVSLLRASPDTGTSLWTESGLKLAYRWEAGISGDMESDLSIALEFQRKGGGVVTCPVAGPLAKRVGVDSGYLFLTTLTKTMVAHPVSARLVLSEIIQDSLMTILAKSAVLTWKD